MKKAPIEEKTSPSLIETVSTSLHLPKDDAEYCAIRGRVVGSFRAAVRESVADARTLFQQPQTVRERLRKDMKRLGLEWPRDYVVHLLNLRNEELIREEIAGDTGEQRRGKK